MNEVYLSIYPNQNEIEEFLFIIFIKTLVKRQQTDGSKWK